MRCPGSPNSAEPVFHAFISLTRKHYTLLYMNTQSFTNGGGHSRSGRVGRAHCAPSSYYEISTSQFSDMKVRKLTRKYGFSGYSIYRYLVSETLCKGNYLLLWCEDTAREVASYWNASLEDVTSIVNGCIQVGLFSDELFRKHGVLTSADLQQNYLKTRGLLSGIPKEFELSVN